MTEEVTVERSLLDQILDAMVVSIEAKDEFDPETVSRLKELRESGGFSKSAAIADAIAEK